MKKLLTASIGLLLACQLSTALAVNTPCSGSKGGVSKCNGSEFICKDGSTSASTQTCTTALARQYAAPTAVNTGAAIKAPVEKQNKSLTERTKEAMGITPATTETTAATKGRAVCAGAKGGVAKCDGSKFVCQDGTTSSSKQICTSALVKEYSNGMATKATSKAKPEPQKVAANQSKDKVKKEKEKMPAKTTSTKGRAVCAGAKGGVAKCDGSKFVCKDGSVSSSKQVCTAALVKEYK